MPSQSEEQSIPFVSLSTQDLQELATLFASWADQPTDFTLIVMQKNGSLSSHDPELQSVLKEVPASRITHLNLSVWTRGRTSIDLSLPFETNAGGRLRLYGSDRDEMTVMKDRVMRFLGKYRRGWWTPVVAHPATELAIVVLIGLALALAAALVAKRLGADGRTQSLAGLIVGGVTYLVGGNLLIADVVGKLLPRAHVPGWGGSEPLRRVALGVGLFLLVTVAAAGINRLIAG